MGKNGSFIMIEGKNIILRPISMNDLEDCTRWVQDPEVVKHAIMEVKTAEEEREWLQGVLDNPNDHVYIIVVKDPNKPIGTCAIHEVANNKLLRNEEGVSLGIMIGKKDEWGKGYGTEAIELLSDHAFKNFSVNRVWLTVDKVHQRAIKAYEKAGMTIVRELEDAGRIYSDGTQYLMEKRFH